MYLPVVVGVDGSPDGLAAAAWAAREAVARRRPLRIVHAVALMPHLFPSSPGPLPCGADILHEVLHELAIHHPDAEAHALEIRDLATAALVAAAEDAELLVLGARGAGGFDGLRVGSVPLHVAARAGCPTVLLPADGATAVPHGEIVVGVDGRRPGEAALNFAFAAAQRDRLPLRVVHTWALPSDLRGPAPTQRERAPWLARERCLLTRALADWRSRYPGVQVLEDAETGSAGSALVEASAKARLLVVGRRTGPVGGRLGPVAHAVLHHASCPVAIVPEQDEKPTLSA